MFAACFVEREHGIFCRWRTSPRGSQCATSCILKQFCQSFHLRTWISSMISRLAILCLCCQVLGCSSDTSNGPRQGDSRLILLSSYPLDVHEPSGLALDAARSSLWTVGNHPQRIYRLSLEGQVREILGFEGDDLEGIACDPSDATLWVVEEKRREVVHLDANGEVAARRQLDLAGEPNSGLEGISLDSNGTLYVLNEKNPGLFITLNDDLSIKNRRQLGFAEDFSALDYHRGRDSFWILSDQSQALFLWNPREGVTATYPLPFDKAEGVAVDEVDDLIYVVSESEDRLYVYAIESSTSGP